MRNPFKRKPNRVENEYNRLLDRMTDMDPYHPHYEASMARLNELDRIRKRTTELKKTIIPAAGGAVAIGAIYAIQQFGGILVPKAAEAYAVRQEAKKQPKELD